MTKELILFNWKFCFNCFWYIVVEKKKKISQGYIPKTTDLQVQLAVYFSTNMHSLL